MGIERVFVAMAPERPAKLIMGARRRVVYAAPSLSLAVASALINVHGSLGEEAVAIVIDAGEAVLHLGYGVADALGLLREGKVTIRHAEGLRISFVVVDDEGFIFALPPLLVEESSSADDRPNAVRASRGQVEQLADAVLRPPSSTGPPLLAPTMPALRLPEIGRSVVSPAQIEKIEEAIKTNPVENFDLTRVVNVFSTYFQFFELEVAGTHIERRTVQLPKELLGSIRDQTMRDRITAAFKMLSKESRISGKDIQRRAVEIRKRFIRHNRVYGGVILKTNLAAVNAEIGRLKDAVEAHSMAVLTRLDRDVKKSIAGLVQAFWRDIVRNPPQELADQGIAKPTTEQAKDYLRYKLIEAFPRAKDLADEMRATTVVKDITWNTLNNPGFVDWLREQWPQRTDLRQPFEQYRAARERLNAPSRAQ
jgi:hypothetical protein